MAPTISATELGSYASSRFCPIASPRKTIASMCTESQIPTAIRSIPMTWLVVAHGNPIHAMAPNVTNIERITTSSGISAADTLRNRIESNTTISTNESARKRPKSLVEIACM